MARMRLTDQNLSPAIPMAETPTSRVRLRFSLQVPMMTAVQFSGGVDSSPRMVLRVAPRPAAERLGVPARPVRRYAQRAREQMGLGDVTLVQRR